MHLHISFASDDYYSQHLAASLSSLFEHNRDFSEITVHILDNNISTQNIVNLKKINEKYRRNIIFYNLDGILKSLKTKFGIPDTISITSYSRLFIAGILDPAIKKIIYADCDSIFTGSLSKLWDTPFDNKLLMGVLDHVSLPTKTKVGLQPDDVYINAGFLFIDLDKWRDIRAEQIMIDFISEYGGNVFHHDQGTFNGCFSRMLKIIPPNYNVMSSFYNFKKVQDILKFYNVEKYYSQTEIENAIAHPIFVHFTPAFLKRPWIMNSRHPLVKDYFYYLSGTAWSNAQPQADVRKLKIKIVDRLFYILGPNYFKKVFR